MSNPTRRVGVRPMGINPPPHPPIPPPRFLDPRRPPIGRRPTGGRWGYRHPPLEGGIPPIRFLARSIPDPNLGSNGDPHIFNMGILRKRTRRFPDPHPAGGGWVTAEGGGGKADKGTGWGFGRREYGRPTKAVRRKGGGGWGNSMAGRPFRPKFRPRGDMGIRIEITVGAWPTPRGNNGAQTCPPSAFGSLPEGGRGAFCHPPPRFASFKEANRGIRRFASSIKEANRGESADVRNPPYPYRPPIRSLTEPSA